MHLGFIDIAYGYAADRPELDEALGGTTSAICFLARELVQAGVTCTFFNKITTPVTAHGIESKPLSALAEACDNPSYTAFLFCGRWMEKMVRIIRQNSRVPLIAWMHESTFNPALVPLLDCFDGIVFVSAWQQRINSAFIPTVWKQAVIRNAMNPLAADLFTSGEAIRAAKTQPPVLLYAGSFARGSFHLPPILEHLRKWQTDFSVEIFCNTNPSGHEASDTEYIAWLRGLPNVTHVGMAGQPTLIDHMKRAAFLVAPNPWPETSCIALIEALATGLTAITTNRAALPETAAGFAEHIAIDDVDHPQRFDAAIDHKLFAEKISEAMNAWRDDPDATEAQLRKQVDYFRTHYQWRQRAGEWVGFVEHIKRV